MVNATTGLDKNQTKLDIDSLDDLDNIVFSGAELTGKIVQMDIDDGTDFNGNPCKNLIIYLKCTSQDNKPYIKRIILKISDSIKSKYYRFVKALKQCKRYTKISENIGNIYVFKEEIIGSGKYESTLLLPKKFISKEPVELEEIDLVSELLEKIENAKKNEELIDSL